ncbi:hypothetical protein PSYMO_38593, partial [Pseudomonas amygdali pv. mori str. 301020]
VSEKPGAVQARERFGSTLTITGTADFKKLVIEA